MSSVSSLSEVILIEAPLACRDRPLEFGKQELHLEPELPVGRIPVRLLGVVVRGQRGVDQQLPYSEELAHTGAHRDDPPITAVRHPVRLAYRPCASPAR